MNMVFSRPPLHPPYPRHQRFLFALLWCLFVAIVSSLSSQQKQITKPTADFTDIADNS